MSRKSFCRFHWLCPSLFLLGLLFALPPALAVEPASGTFTIKSISPSADSRRITIEFTEAVKVGDLQNALRLVPAAPIYWWDVEQVNRTTVRLNTYAAYGQDYLISIAEGFKNGEGKKYLRGEVKKFTMPHRTPALKFASKRSVIERDSRQMVHLDLTNVDQVLYESVQVPVLLAPWVEARIQSEPGREIKAIERDARLVRDALAKVLARNSPFTAFLPETLYESHLFFSTSQEDVDSAYSVPLTFRKEKEIGSPLVLRFEDNASGSVAATPAKLYQVTDLALSAKTAPDGLLIWATSIRTGAPVGDVSLVGFINETRASFLGNTNSEGVLVLKSGQTFPTFHVDRPHTAESPVREELDYSKVQFIAGVGRADAAFLRIARPEALVPDGIPTAATYESVAAATNSVLFTERGVYRPGERVHFKGFLRRHADGDTVAPKDRSAEFVVRDSENNEVHRETSELNEFGTSSGSFLLPNYAPLGWYTLRFKGPETESPWSTRSFLVQEFQPPRHQTDVRFRREKGVNEAYVNNPREEERIVCTLSGRYAVGGPLKHGRVRWKIFSAPTEFPTPGFPGYTFGNPSLLSEEFIDSGESILDESGEVEVRLPISSDVLSGKQGIKVTATVIDFDGRASSTSDTYRVSPPARIGIAAAPVLPEIDVPVQFNCVILDESESPISSGRLEVSILQRSYVNSRKRGEDGNAYWTWTEIWKRMPGRTETFTDGSASFDLSFPEAGQFLVEVAFRDEEGRTSASTRVINVTGPFAWYYDDPEESHPRAEQISIRTDQSEYGIGDVMLVSLKGRRSFGSTLVTLETNRVIEHYLLPEGRSEIEIPIQKKHLPNFYVSALAAVPRGEYPMYPGQFDRDAPSFAFGAVKVGVKADLNPLNVEIAPGVEPLASHPAANMTIDFKVTDSKKRPARAELAVAVVDEQVLRLTAFETPQLDGLIQFHVPLSVFSFDLRKRLQNQTPYEEFRNDPLTGGGGGGEELIDAKVRRDFSPTAFFDPSVVTDEDGTASVSFRFPDTLTSYRVYVVAVDESDRIATSERQAVVKKDFYLEPGVPRFLRQGDQAEFQVAAFNKTDAPQTFDLIVESSDSLTTSIASKAFTVPPFDRVLAPVRAAAGRTGPAGIRLSGVSARLSDSVESPLPVQSALPIRRENRFLTVTGQGTLSYSFPEETSWLDPGQYSPDDLAFQVSLSGSPWARLAPGLRYLFDYPYGCVEQTSSRLLPLSAIRALDVAGSIPNVSPEQLENYISKGVERLLSMQLGSGMFSSWPGSNHVDRWGTLYALTALQFTSELGTPVDQASLDRGFTALRGLALGGEEDPLAGSGRGLALMLLARRGMVSWQDLQPLWQQWGDKGREEKLFIALAAVHLGDAPAQEVQDRAREVLDLPRGTGDESPYRALNRETAAELLLADRVSDATASRDRLAAELLESMKPAGYWTSTADTGWALVALVDYFAHLPESSSTNSGDVKLPNGESVAFTLDGSKPVVIPIDATSFIEKPEVTIHTGSPSPVFAVLRIQHPIRDVASPAEEAPISVHKTWRNTAGTEEIHVGDVIEVMVEMRFARVGNRHVVLDDPLPAGWTAVNSLLATEEPAGDLGSDEDAYYAYWDADGFYRFVPNHSEFRDDRIVAVRDWVGRGEYRYSYFARAVCAGTFHIPPTQVQLMYEPESTAYTGAFELSVLNR